MFLEISKLQKEKSWVHVSLGGVALKIKKIISLPSTGQTLHSDNIHEIMVNVNAAYGTVKNHIRDTFDEIISLGSLIYDLLSLKLRSDKRHTRD